MGEIIKRHGGYSLRWYEGGRRRVLASKQATHAEAKRMLIEIEARVGRGEAGIPERRPVAGLTVAELAEQFLARYSRPKLKNLEQYRYQARSKLQKVLPQLGKLRAAQVQPSDVARLRDALAREYAAGTVKLALAILSVMFSWAVREGLAKANPCKGVERPATAASLDFLTREEVSQLLAAAEAGATTLKGRMLHVGIAVAVHTGLRKGELLGLRWLDLDFETRRLTVARSYAAAPKSGRARHLRLPQELVPLLRAWREHCPKSADGAVLPIGLGPGRTGGTQVMLGLPRLMARAGLRTVAHPWHILRHTFASHHVMAGGNILALQKILGHADLTMTLVYAHLAPDFLGEEMDRVKFR